MPSPLAMRVSSQAPRDSFQPGSVATASQSTSALMSARMQAFHSALGSGFRSTGFTTA